MLVPLCVLSVVIVGVTAQGGPPSGPGPGEPTYVLNMMSSMYVCPDDDSKAFVSTSKLQLEAFNDTTSFLKGFIVFLKDFDECTMAEIKINKEANGRLEMVMTHEICDVCAEMRDPESNYADQFKFFGFPDTCPFPAGEYPIHDLVADFNDMPINSANVGCYEAIITIFKSCSGDCTGDRTFIGCMKLDCCIEPA